ncbi:MAG: nucleoside deaminase [bacterium]
MNATETTDYYYMQLAFREALKAQAVGDVPVGAVAVLDGKVIARAHNLKERRQSPCAHAELLVVEKAAKKLGSWRLLGVTLYSTLEPCPMCAGVMLQSRIKRLVYGAPDLRWGAVETFYTLFEDERWNHKIEVVAGVMRKEVEDVLRGFFKKIRVEK